MTAVRPPRFCEYQDVGKHQRLMDDVYKNQRYVYDFTRKFYLLGRDHLIEQLNAGPDDNILEVGCGTGRNLLKASKLFPGTQFLRYRHFPRNAGHRHIQRLSHTAGKSMPLWPRRCRRPRYVPLVQAH